MTATAARDAATYDESLRRGLTEAAFVSTTGGRAAPSSTGRIQR